MEKIKIYNKDGIKLKGYYHKAASKIVVLYVHGLTGAYDELAQSVGAMCERENIAFCFAYNQGAGEIKELERKNGTTCQTILSGSCYENFNSIIPDIDCFVKFLEKEGYTDFFLIGHSMGNNKLIYYLNQNKSHLFKGFVLLAPQDMEAIIKSEYHKELLYEANQLIQMEKGTEILSKPFMGYCKMSANTLYQYNHFEGLLSLPYRQSKGDWRYYNNIDMPKKIIIGEFDQGLDLTNGKNVYDNMKTFPSGDIVVIDNTKHTFKNHELEVAEQIKIFIQRGNNCE